MGGDSEIRGRHGTGEGQEEAAFHIGGIAHSHSDLPADQLWSSPLCVLHEFWSARPALHDQAALAEEIAGRPRLRHPHLRVLRRHLRCGARRPHHFPSLWPKGTHLHSLFVCACVCVCFFSLFVLWGFLWGWCLDWVGDSVCSIYLFLFFLLLCFSFHKIRSGGLDITSSLGFKAYYIFPLFCLGFKSHYRLVIRDESLQQVFLLMPVENDKRVQMRFRDHKVQWVVIGLKAPDQ